MRLSDQTKRCAICTTPFRCDPRYSRKQWEKRLYCSSECSGTAVARSYAEKRPSLRDKFEARFIKTDGCWQWAGTQGAYGYGQMVHAGRTYRAHVLALRFDGRPVPKGMVACHRCDNPGCVRPDHLYVGTVQDNSNDAVARGRTPKGERHHFAKLTDEQVRQARQINLPYAQIARIFGVSRPTITRAIKGVTWGHVDE